MKTEVTRGTLNGLNLDRMHETMGALKENPGLASFNFRATNDWVKGGNNRSTIQGFYGAGKEDDTRMAPFVLEADEPDVLLGTDKGPNPVEYVLHALAACIVTAVVLHAAAQGLKITKVESKIDGDIDVRGLVGLSDLVRKGYEAIRLNIRYEGDLTPEQFREFCNSSPVLDIIANPVPVTIDVQRG